MIKQIFDEIANESSTNKKMKILEKYKDNELLKKVLYLANSSKVKYYIKQLPEYTIDVPSMELTDALVALEKISKREVTGDEAREHLKKILSSLSRDDAYIIECIIEKDCKINMGVSNINKVIPKLIEDTPYMGAISFNPKKVKKLFENGKFAYSQTKMDGRYCNAIIQNHIVEMESRQGEPTILTSSFINELTKLPNCVLNGELTMDGVPRYISNGMITSLIDITKKRDERGEKLTAKKIDAFEKENNISFQDAMDSIRFTVWDIITVDEYNSAKSVVPYNKRFEKLNHLICGMKMVDVVETRIVKNYEEALEHFQEMLNRGEEGTIVKAYDGEWKDGKQVWQIKMKLEMDVDLKITGFNYGTGKNADVISSLNCETSDGLLKTRPTGINEKMMVYITENQDKLLGAIIECKCSGLSRDSDGNYSLMHPVFKTIRDDKFTCNSLESVKEIEAMVKGLK